MPLGYNPQDKAEGGGKVPPGDYRFQVTAAEETTFRSGNEGLKVELLVDVGGGRAVRNFDNFVYTRAALWKLEEFLASLGLDFNNPPEVHQIRGRVGRAKFVEGEKYLEVGSYYPASANNFGAPSPQQQQWPQTPPPPLPQPTQQEQQHWTAPAPQQQQQMPGLQAEPPPWAR